VTPYSYGPVVVVPGDSGSGHLVKYHAQWIYQSEMQWNSLVKFLMANHTK